MFIRVSGQFVQILKLWMKRYGYADAHLESEITNLSRSKTIPVEEWRDYLARAEKLSACSHVGIQVGSLVELRHVGVLGYLLLNSDTLIDALKSYQLCERRFYSVNFCQLTHSGNEFSITWPDKLGSKNSLFVQTAITTLVAFLRQRFPSSFKLNRVSLTEHRPVNVKPYEDFFQCPIEFDSSNPGISLDYTSAAEIEAGKLAKEFQDYRNSERATFKEIISDYTPFFEELQRHLMRSLPTATVSLKSTSLAMSCSTRTLQRRLHTHHLSFQTMLDALREQLACRYLKEQSLSYVEIAILLGYSEQSSFNRAFKHWTGQSPSQYKMRIH